MGGLFLLKRGSKQHRMFAEALMTIVNPLAWGLLLLAIPIILFFLLKVRFRKELVSTMLFWQQVFEERRTRKLYSRLRFFLSLLLALLFLMLLTAAVLDLTFFATHNNRYVIIIDNSASMSALHADGTSRLNFAKKQAAKWLNQLAPSQRVAIVSANVTPQIIAGFTDHPGTLKRKLAKIPATDFPGDLPTAIRLAEQLIADTSDFPIFVYTNTGDLIDNLAITRFQPRRLPEHLADYEIFVEVVNFGTQTVQTRLEIDCEGKLVDVLPLSLEPNRPVTKIVRNTSSSGGLFRATFSNTDSFSMDNTAVAFLSEQFVQRILLYGKENFFLWHILQALPLTEIVLISEVPDSVPQDSVLVFYQTVPATLPSGNIMIIDPQNDCNLFRLEEQLVQPMVAKIDEENSLVRSVPTGLCLPGAKSIVPKTSHSRTLLETAEEFPLYLQFVSENQQALVLSADLNQGDFSLRTAFPILISQALAHFRNSEELQKAYSTAEPVRLTVQTNQSQVILRSPSGREEVFPCQKGLVSLDRLGECGVWSVFEPESDRTLARIACNLFNASESNLCIPNEASHKVPEMVRSTLLGRYPIRHYLALIALILTVAEWFFYQRRWID